MVIPMGRLSWQTIPPELQCAIAAHCDNGTLTRLCLAHSSWNAASARVLYSIVALQFTGIGAKQRRAEACAGLLATYPAKAALVRSFLVFVGIAQDARIYATLVSALNSMHCLRDLRIRVQGHLLDCHLLRYSVCQLMTSHSFDLHTLHLPAQFLEESPASFEQSLFVQKDTLRVLGLERWDGYQDAAAWRHIQTVANSGCGVFSYEIEDRRSSLRSMIAFFPTRLPQNKWPAYFDTMAESCRGAPYTASPLPSKRHTLHIALQINKPSDLPPAAAALAATFPHVEQLVVRFRSSTEAVTQVALDPASVAHALAPFAWLQRLLFLSWAEYESNMTCVMTVAERIELAENTRAHGCRDLLSVSFLGDLLLREDVDGVTTWKPHEF